MEATPVTATTRRGVALYRAGHDGAAIAALRATLAEQGADAPPAAWQYLASALWRADQRSQALAVLRDAVLASPEAAWPWRHLGAALLAAGRDSEAALALAEAVAVVAAEAPAERLAEPPAESLAAELRELGVLALGRLRRAQPAGPQGWRLVISLLGRLSPSLARERLLELVQSAEPEQRIAAAPLAPELAELVGEELLLALLADDEDAVRAAVRPTLMARAADDVAWLSRLLAHSDPRVRHETVAAIGALGDVEPLRRVYAASDDAKVRRECLRGFGQMAQTDLLALVLWDEAGALRAEAARLLGEQPSGEAAAALRDRIEAEPDDYVRGIMESALNAMAPEPDVEDEDAQSGPGDDIGGLDDTALLGDHG